MATKIAIINRKGGVGKTTTAINLTAALARNKKRCLIIDLDDQCNTTSALGFDYNGKTVFDALIDTDLDNAKLTIYSYDKNIDYVAASQDLENIEKEMSSHFSADQKLRLLMYDVETEYDFVIYDCPPSAGLMSRSALLAADYVLVPHDCGQFSECGIPKAVSLIKQARMINRDLKMLGFLLTKFQNTTLCREARETLTTAYPEYRVLKTTISNCAALGKTFADHKTIFTWKGNGDPSQGKVDHARLADEIISAIQ